LAVNNCSKCHGLGLRIDRRGAPTPCGCVTRAIFRACYQRFRTLASSEKHMSRVVFERRPGARGRASWGRKTEEYCADFYLVSKRTLPPGLWDVFRFHFLLGADWKLCCSRLGIDRGTFFHDVYIIQETLGRSFRELEPYGLFPLDAYFGAACGPSGEERAVASPVSHRGRVLRPPVRAA